MTAQRLALVLVYANPPKRWYWAGNGWKQEMPTLDIKRGRT